MPLLHYRQYVLLLVVLPPRSPHFVQVIHTTGGVICGYRCCVKCPCLSNTVQDSYVTLCHSVKNVQYLKSLYVTIYHNRMLQGDHTFSYCNKKFTRACMKWSTHAHGTKSEVEILNFSTQPWDSQGNGNFVTVSQGAIQTLDSS